MTWWLVIERRQAAAQEHRLSQGGELHNQPRVDVATEAASCAVVCHALHEAFCHVVAAAVGY